MTFCPCAITEAELLGCELVCLYPPIPDRSCDWGARHKDTEGKIEAYGRTKGEAAENWLEWRLDRESSVE